jgi:hypothetical protein
LISKEMANEYRSGWVLNLLATFGWFAATIWFSYGFASKVSLFIAILSVARLIIQKEHVNEDENDETCETPIQPFEGLVDEKRGQITLETV